VTEVRQQGLVTKHSILRVAYTRSNKSMTNLEKCVNFATKNDVNIYLKLQWSVYRFGASVLSTFVSHWVTSSKLDTVI